MQREAQDDERRGPSGTGTDDLLMWATTSLMTAATVLDGSAPNGPYVSALRQLMSGREVADIARRPMTATDTLPNVAQEQERQERPFQVLVQPLIDRRLPVHPLAVRDLFAKPESVQRYTRLAVESRAPRAGIAMFGLGLQERQIVDHLRALVLDAQSGDHFRHSTPTELWGRYLLGRTPTDRRGHVGVVSGCAFLDLLHQSMAACAQELAPGSNGDSLREVLSIGIGIKSRNGGRKTTEFRFGLSGGEAKTAIAGLQAHILKAAMRGDAAEAVVGVAALHHFCPEAISRPFRGRAEALAGNADHSDVGTTVRNAIGTARRLTSGASKE